MLRRHRGFTLIELVMVIVILGILAVIAIPQFMDQSSAARTAAIQTLSGSVNTAVNLVNLQTSVTGSGSPGQQSQITWITMGGAQIRIWSGYPDRWCDGIGLTQQGAAVPAAGCYLSASAVPYGNYTFYGYGNSQIPNGDAGWRIENSPNPTQCSVQYTYNGSGAPVITTNTSGC